MEHLQHGMQRKWERHFHETKTNISICLLIVGISSFLCLFVVWPQIFSAIVFDSRLSNYVITDIEDYWTCTDHYNNFVIDKPSQDIRLFSFYVFNISNTFTTMQRGFKPTMVETGPYAYELSSVKYEVYFEPDDSSTVSYKEYTTLKAVTDKEACKRMYYRMDKNDLLENDPCLTSDCTCKDPTSMVTIINPLFAKFITEEGSNMLLARYSSEVFSYMKSFYTTEFVEATKAHLVQAAFEEIYVFRGFMKTYKILKTAFDYVATTTSISLRATNYLAKDYAGITYCGLDIYNATQCPWNAAPAMQTIRVDTPSTKAIYQSVTDADIPFNSIPTILNESSSLSFLNELEGFPKWIAVGVYLGPIDFPFNKSSAMITDEELRNLYDTMQNDIAKISFGSTPTTTQLLGTRLLLHVITYHIQTYWIADYASQAKQLVYDEWKSTSDAVVCSILGHRCVWQWGAVSHLSDFQMADHVIQKLIDRATKVNTNPASLYYDGNSPSIYDSYAYCQQVILPDIEPNECMDIDFAKIPATVTFPAGLASAVDQIDQINSTLIAVNYAKKSQTEKNQFIYLGCNISYLMHSVYRNSTNFHDEYVIRYLNKYKYPSYTHNFSPNNWEELGYSQWAGGYVTYALESVFSTYNLVRDGMWHIGNANYYRTIPEFFSWSILNGHPFLRVSNITEAKLLLDSLARDDEIGVELRHHIMYRATTLIGDDTFQYTDTWYRGEYTYIPEYKKSNFSCIGQLEPICNILKYSDESSSTQCNFINNEIYSVCIDRIKKRKKWVTNCEIFETSITNSIDGIACSLTSLFGENHPVLSNRGLIVQKMMFSLVIDVIMKNNLWCPEYTGCEFQQSGLFITLSVNKLLFNGYTDASLIKYLDLKHLQHNITIECVGNPYDTCGNKNYLCSQDGIKIKLQNNEEIILNYETLSHHKYFVERFYIFNFTKFLWPHDINETLALESQNIIETTSSTSSTSGNIITIINPYYALFPAWDNITSVEFIKHYQCQGRYLYGKPYLYNSCITTINTGKKDISQVSNIIKYLGNDTIYQFDTGMTVNGTINEQLQPGLWKAFRIYPYSYQGQRKGSDYLFISNPVLWNDIHRLRLQLTQSEIESWDKLQRVFPTFRNNFDVNDSSTYYVLTRRFQEDFSSWRPYKSTGVPKDSYGMKYEIPVAMSSVEKLAGYPIYIGTPHNYGNQLWGGAEFLQVAGLNPIQQEHRSYMDYDPITGKILRRAFRQQFNLRIERSSLFQILFSSQSRCVSPTKSFTLGTGYGCFTYIPLFWTEDSRIIDPNEYDQLRDHYYTRPERFNVVGQVGLVIGILCIVFGTILYYIEHRKRKTFMSKIYID